MDKPRKIEVKKEGEDKKTSKNKQPRYQTEPRRTTTLGQKFKGATEDLYGFIYDVGVFNQSDIFVMTTKKLANYAGRTCKEPQDIQIAIEDLKDTTFTLPTKQTRIDSAIADILLSKDLDIFVKRKSTYRQNKASMTAVALSQCSEAMKAKLESEDKFEQISNKGNVIALLKMIRSIAFDFESKRYPFLAVYSSMQSFYMFYQKPSMTNDAYLESYQNQWDMVSHCGGNLMLLSSLVEHILKEEGITSPTSDERDAATTKARAAYKAMTFLCGLNKDRYQDLLDDLANSYLAGQDEYPKTLVAAYNLVTNWKSPHKHPKLKTNDGVAFNTVKQDMNEKKQASNNGVVRTKAGKIVWCFICGENHYKSNCPNADQEQAGTTNTTNENTDNDRTTATNQTPSTQTNSSDQQSRTSGLTGSINVTTGDDEEWDQNIDYTGLSFTQVNNVLKLPSTSKTSGDSSKSSDTKDIGGPRTVSHEHLLNQVKGTTINKWWSLLDNQSTVDVFSNRKMLQNIHQVIKPLTITSTGGSTTTNLVGFLQGYGWVWYYPEGIANILLLARVKPKFRVMFDSGADNQFHVHLPGNKVCSFKESEKGLYYSDICENKAATVLVNTVEYNKSKYSNRDYLRVLNARKLQNIICGTSYNHFRNIIRTKQLPNCPFMVQDGCGRGYIWYKFAMFKRKNDTTTFNTRTRPKSLTTSRNTKQISGRHFIGGHHVRQSD